METLVLLKPHPSALLNSTVVESWTAKPEIPRDNPTQEAIFILLLEIFCYPQGKPLV